MTPLLVPLLTPRLQLEPVRADHADAMYEGLRDRSLYAYEADGPPDSRAALRARYARLGSGRSPGDDQHWLNWVLVLRATGAAAGYVQATVDDDLAYASVGYVVLAAHQRRGLGREGVGAMVDHLVAHGVGVLHATIDVRNAASVGLVEALGFARIATRPSDDVIGGVRGLDYDYVFHAPRAAAAPAPNPPA